MELRDYTRIARRRWLLIVSTLIAVVGLAAIITAQMTPRYTSTARLFVSGSTSTTTADAYQASQFSQQRIASYVDVINSVDVARRVATQLNLRTSPETLSSQIKASTVPDTVLLDVKVTDTNPFEAKRINDALVLEVRSLVSDLETPPGRATPTLKATVVNSPSLPVGQSSPRVTLNLAAATLVGLLLGLGLAVARELSDATVKDLESIESLSDCPVLSGLSYDPDVFKTPLVSGLPSHSPRVEAFRVLRTNMEFLDVDSPSKMFVVTSSMPGEGKSTTAANVAIAFASAGRNTVLVDGDLRRPQAAALLGLIPDVGLTTVLTGQTDLDDALQPHPESGLSVLAAGVVPPNPAELIQSRVMQDLVSKLRSEFDVIIVDAPPLLPVTDAALLASEADGAVVVVRHGKTRRDQLRAAGDRLHAVDAPLLGVVFNMISNRGSASYGYGYGYGPDDSSSAGRGTLTWRQRLDRRRAMRRTASEIKSEAKKTK